MPQIYNSNMYLNFKNMSYSPEFLGLPKERNHSPPRRQISGATATVSTFVTVVGHPNTPTLAGNGGFRRGFP